MKTIFKYAIYPGHNDLSLPKGSDVLSALNQHDNIRLYALIPVGNSGDTEQWVINAVGTGFTNTEMQEARFIGSVGLYDGDLVYHVFARRVDPTPSPS